MGSSHRSFTELFSVDFCAFLWFQSRTRLFHHKEVPLAQLANDILHEAVQRFPMSYVPVIKWKKLRVSAGIGHYASGTSGLSSLILDTPEKLRLTLLHEYAHLLAVERHGRKAANHGAYW